MISLYPREHPYLSLHTRILCNSYSNTSRHQYYTNAHKDMRIPNNYAHKTKPQCNVCTFNSTTTCELRAGSTFFSRFKYLKKKFKILFQLMHCLIGWNWFFWVLTQILQLSVIFAISSTQLYIAPFGHLEQHFCHFLHFQTVLCTLLNTSLVYPLNSHRTIILLIFAFLHITYMH